MCCWLSFLWRPWRSSLFGPQVTVTWPPYIAPHYYLSPAHPLCTAAKVITNHIESLIYFFFRMYSVFGFHRQCNVKQTGAEVSIMIATLQAYFWTFNSPFFNCCCENLAISCLVGLRHVRYIDVAFRACKFLFSASMDYVLMLPFVLASFSSLHPWIMYWCCLSCLQAFLLCIHGLCLVDLTNSGVSFNCLIFFCILCFIHFTCWLNPLEWRLCFAFSIVPSTL